MELNRLEKVSYFNKMAQSLTRVKKTLKSFERWEFHSFRLKDGQQIHHIDNDIGIDPNVNRNMLSEWPLHITDIKHGNM